MSPRCWRAKASAARGGLARGQRCPPRSSRSCPRSASCWRGRSRAAGRRRRVTLNKPIWLFSCAWRHRLGLTVAGALPCTKAKPSKSQITVPAAFLPARGRGDEAAPGVLEGARVGQVIARATASLACWVVALASPPSCAAPRRRPWPRVANKRPTPAITSKAKTRASGDGVDRLLADCFPSCLPWRLRRSVSIFALRRYEIQSHGRFRGPVLPRPDAIIIFDVMTRMRCVRIRHPRQALALTICVYAR